MSFDKTEKTGRQKFFEYFEDRFSEKIKSLEMASIVCPERIFNKLGLTSQNGSNELWGLLVFCESKKIYFYVHPSENYMSAMMRVARQDEPPKEQISCLTDIPGFKIVEGKKHWYDFFIPGLKFEINAEINCDGIRERFIITTQKNASLVRKLF